VGFRAYAGFPIRDPDDEIVGVCAVLDFQPREWSAAELAGVGEGAQACTAFAEQQQARVAADQQRRFLDALLDSLRTGVAACDPQGRLVFTNEAIRRMTSGLPPDADLDRWIMHCPATDADGASVPADAVPLARAVRGERLRDVELVIPGPGRRTTIVLADAQPITGAGGENLGAVVALRDITERRRAERFARAQTAVVEVLAGAASLGDAFAAVVRAVAGELRWPNAELWLVEQDVLLPVARHTDSDTAGLVLPDRLQPGQGVAGRAWQRRSPQWTGDRLQSDVATTDPGRLTWVAVPVISGGQVLAVLSLSTDTVEDPQGPLVALLSGIAGHLGQFLERRRAEELALALARTKDEYLALVGHELRTPLTSIAASAELLHELDPEALAADGRRLVNLITRNSDTLRHIVADLLDLAAIDSGHAPIACEPVDLAAVVQAAVATAAPAAAARHISLDTRLHPRTTVRGDHTRLAQVVAHLLDNAVRHSHPGSTVAVSLTRINPDIVELTITDTGIGIPPDEQHRVFAHFYRSSRTREHGIPGAGLGLAISQAIIARHHGTIRLLPTTGPGTRISVRLHTAGS
jgi:signal transduction histidine kinase